MTKEQEQEYLQHVVVVFGKLQSLSHDVDRMLETGVKREIKQRLNNFQAWLEPLLNETTGLFDNDGNVAFTEYTRQLDQIGLQFKLSIADQVVQTEE